MKTTIPALVAVVALASSSVACSAEEKNDEVNTSSAISALQSPTGTLTRESAGKAFGGYRQQRAESSKVSAPAANGGGMATQSIKLLDQASSSAAGQGGSQRCPSGGSMSYQAEQSADGALVKVRADACAFEDGFSFDGNMVLLASKKSILGISASDSPAPKKPSAPAKPGTGSDTGSEGDAYGDSYGDGMGSGSGVSEAQGSSYGNGIVALLIAAKGTATYEKKQTSLEFALLTESRYMFLAVKVNDGSIVIGMRDDGIAIVRTKNGNWNCQQSGTRWTCTSDKGESLDAAEETGGDLADNGPAVPPSAGTGSSDKAPVPPPSGSGDQG